MQTSTSTFPSGGGFGEHWKKYNTTDLVTYFWDKYNITTVKAYKWAKYTITTTENTVVKYRSDVIESDNTQTWTGTVYKVNSSSAQLTQGYVSTISSITNKTKIEMEDIRAGMWITGPNSYRANFVKGVKAAANGGYIEFSYSKYVTLTGYNETETVIVKDALNGYVTSSSRTAHPDDGVDGDYWYVYDSTSTSYRKGATSYGEVSSTTNNTYPNNSYSGSYWYVYDRSETSKIQGAFVENVVHYKSDAFPTNGLHTDGYWYVKDT